MEMERFQKANAKRVSQSEGLWTQGKAEASIVVPPEIPPGAYVVRLYASSSTQDATAGARWRLEP